ncbi:MAG: 16S rRNA (guanine(527)-N(7))-methyltransferase RsmG [Alistipes sp.]|nr:16S rRNA (guanine(527)-N(7))-methyltransferase RsmG [Alistipes sp.]
MNAQLIFDYFPDLTDRQREQFSALGELYADWNSKINVISRKDFQSLYLRHVLHSLAIAKVCRFDAGARIADVGCGGGFPSVPLAIMFPEAQFTAVDSIAKKITVVQGVSRSLGLENLTAVNCRFEQLSQRFDYVVSRAVTDSATLTQWVWNRIEKGCRGTLPNGILTLKGGELAEELALTGKRWTIFEISRLFDDEFFSTKKVVYTQR